MTSLPVQQDPLDTIETVLKSLHAALVGQRQRVVELEKDSTSLSEQLTEQRAACEKQRAACEEDKAQAVAAAVANTQTIAVAACEEDKARAVAAAVAKAQEAAVADAEKVKQDIQRLNVDIRDKEAALVQKEQERVECEKRATRKDEDITGLRVRLDQLQQGMPGQKDLSNRLDAATAALRQAQADRDAANIQKEQLAAQQAQTNDELQALRVTREDLQKKLTDVNNEVEIANQWAREKKKELSDAREQIGAAKTELERVRNLLAQRQDATARIARIELELNQQRERTGEYRTMVESLEAEKRALRKQYEDARREIEKLKSMPIQQPQPSPGPQGAQQQGTQGTLSNVRPVVLPLQRDQQGAQGAQGAQGTLPNVLRPVARRSCGFQGVASLQSGMPKTFLPVLETARLLSQKTPRFKLLFFGETTEGKKCVTKAMQQKGAHDIDVETAALDYEAGIYRELSALITNSVCPNLVQMISFGVCERSSFLKDVQTLTSATAMSDVSTRQSLTNYETQLRRTRPEKDEPTPPSDLNPKILADWAFSTGNRVHALTTMEPPGFKGLSLHAYIRGVKGNATMPSVLFQMLYTLWSCYKAGIVHNDCHLGNWLVGTSPTGEPLTYELDDSTVAVMPNTVTVYLYDWDRGYSKNLGPNPILVADPYFCKEFGQCNELRPQHDNVLASCGVAMQRGLKGVCTPSLLNKLNFNREFMDASIPVTTVCKNDTKNPNYGCFLSAQQVLGLKGYTAGKLLWHPYFDVLRKPKSQASGKIWGVGNRLQKETQTTQQQPQQQPTRFTRFGIYR